MVAALKRYVPDSPGKTAGLFLKILGHKIYPLYPKEDIIFIVKTLKEKEQEDKADLICNLYGEEGEYFLRELYSG